MKKKPSRTFLKLGHWSLAIFGFTLLLFGIEHFVYTDYIASLIPSWILLSNFVTYLAGVLFVLIAVSFISRRRIHLSASLFAVMFIVIILVVHTPRLILNPHIHNEWTSGFIALAMCGIGFMIGGITPDPEDDSPKHFLDIDEKHFHIS